MMCLKDLIAALRGELQQYGEMLARLERIEQLPGGRRQIRLRDTPEPILVSLRLAPILNRKLKALRR